MILIYNYLMCSANVFKNLYSKEEWINYGRRDTLSLFLENEYGFYNEKFKNNLSYVIEKKNVVGNIIIEKIEMKYKNHPMYFYIYLPNDSSKKLRTFITIVHPLRDKGELLIDDYKQIEGFCPIEDLISKGFAVILLSAGSVAEDKIGGEYSGIFKDLEIERTNDSCGVIGAWAWACSKIFDYISTRREFDLSKVAVVGHSRGGKTALLASALDERFLLAISNCSGNSGAALSRNNSGERIKDIVTNFPYWFNENYKKYIDNEEELPFDQHQLLGLIAPRYCYINSASEDYWADPEGELESCILASQYFNLFNVDGYIGPKRIRNDIAYDVGHIAYCRKKGAHCLEKKDWINFINYFNQISK